MRIGQTCIGSNMTALGGSPILNWFDPAFGPHGSHVVLCPACGRRLRSATTVRGHMTMVPRHNKKLPTPKTLETI